MSLRRPAQRAIFSVGSVAPGVLFMPCALLCVVGMLSILIPSNGYGAATRGGFVCQPNAKADGWVCGADAQVKPIRRTLDRPTDVPPTPRPRQPASTDQAIPPAAVVPAPAPETGVSEVQGVREAQEEKGVQERQEGQEDQETTLETDLL